MGCNFISLIKHYQANIKMERLCRRLHTKNVPPPQCAWLANFVQSWVFFVFFLRPAGSMALNWITDPVAHKRSCAEKEHIFCGIYSATFSVLRAWLLCFSKYIAGVLFKSSVPALSSTLTHFHKRHLVSVYFVDQRTGTNVVPISPPTHFTTSQLKLQLTMSDIHVCCSGGKLIIEC